MIGKSLGLFLTENRDRSIPNGDARRAAATQRRNEISFRENQLVISAFFVEAFQNIASQILDGSPGPSFSVSTDLWKLGLYLDDSYGENVYADIVKNFADTLKAHELRMDIDYQHGDDHRDPDVAYKVDIVPI